MEVAVQSFYTTVTQVEILKQSPLESVEFRKCQFQTTRYDLKNLDSGCMSLVTDVHKKFISSTLYGIPMMSFVASCL